MNPATPTRHTIQTMAILLAGLMLAACTGDIDGVVQEAPGEAPLADPEPNEGDEMGTFTYGLGVGTQVKVCNVRYGLNNRSGASTRYMVLRVLKPNTRARIMAVSGSWYRLDVLGMIGWSHGKYICSAGGSSTPTPTPTPSGCHKGNKFGWEYCSPSCPCGENEGDCDSDAECNSGLYCAHDVGSSYGVTRTVDVCRKRSQPRPQPTNPGGSGINVSQNGIINASKAFVGFSYWWGGAAFKVGSRDYGRCISSTYGGHRGTYGGDCSGFAGKVWQLPNAMPFEQNRHPYSTYHFKNQRNYWNAISRNSTRRADAMVYNNGSHGHIIIFESGNAWGQSWVYEAKGCSYGVVHNLRSVSSSYQSRRRHGL